MGADDQSQSSTIDSPLDYMKYLSVVSVRSKTFLSNWEAENLLCLVLSSQEGLPGSSTGYSRSFPSLLVSHTADSTSP